MSSAEAVDLSRRQLLRGDAVGKNLPVRPPWAIAEAEFTSLCDRCNDCIYACSERIIRFGSGGFPEIDFSERGCTFCGDCVAACGRNALVRRSEKSRPWGLKARIAASCLANRGVVCRSCGEACDERAIRFELRVGGAAEPCLDSALCTGCGSCVGVCPVRAIEVSIEKAATQPREVRTK